MPFVVTVYATKACQWSGGIAALFCNIGSRWVRMIRLAAWLLKCWGKSPLYVLTKWLCGYFGQERILLSLLGIIREQTKVIHQS